jgi:hypothetical protein
MPEQMPPFDQRLGDVEFPKSELDLIIREIRSTSDRIAAESWEEFYDRTRLLGLAELERRRLARLRRR